MCSVESRTSLESLTNIQEQLQRHRDPDSVLALQRLWQAGAFEARLLATKIIGKNAAKNPTEALDLMR